MPSGFKYFLISDKRGYISKFKNGGSKKIISKSSLLFFKNISAVEFTIKAFLAFKLFYYQ